MSRTPRTRRPNPRVPLRPSGPSLRDPYQDPLTHILHSQAQVRRRVLVKYKDAIVLPPNPIGPNLDVPGWSDWLGTFPGLTNRLLFKQAPTTIDTLLATAQQRDASYTPVNLRNYVAVYVPDGVSPDQVATLVLTHPDVEHAEVEPLPMPPPTVTADPKVVDQGYLKPASEGGIDAVYAWDIPGGQGTNQQLIDLEEGWTLDHEDLDARGITVISGLNYRWFNHGTSVLGIIAAVDNGVGCAGIALDAGQIRCVSPDRAVDSDNVLTEYSISEAILDAVEVLQVRFGSVLLIEQVTSTTDQPLRELPVEIVQANFDAIRLATALGIVVVEAGGNSGVDFDTLTIGGTKVLHPDHGEDSGAILVAASTSTLAHTPVALSCRGKRINCYAWGENIVAPTTNGDGTSRNSYTNAFSNTSGASAIIAGAALVVQGLAEASLKPRFGAWQLRDLLSDPANGTSSQNPPSDRIGVMPDLRKIIQSEALGLAPDVYLRDHIGDDGDPHDEYISMSPDVFVVPIAPLANPQGSWGEGSGTEDEIPDATVRTGVDNHVYVRVRNRGKVDAKNVSATIYWAPPSSLLDVSKLQLIGKVHVPDVVTGDRLTVSDALLWPAANVPASGHYCFVALVGSDLDSAPEPAKFLNWDQFKYYIRENNNVTWRNFDVIDMEPAMSIREKVVDLPFEIGGAWDRARDMTIEIGGQIPRSATLRLAPPPGYRRTSGIAGRRELLPDLSEWEVVGSRSPRLVLRDVHLGKGMRIPLRLLIHIPKALRNRTYEVFVRQLHQGDEVGRVTWRLRP